MVSPSFVVYRPMPTTHRPRTPPTPAVAATLAAALLVATPTVLSSCQGGPVFRSTSTLDAGLASVAITGPSDAPGLALGGRTQAQSPAAEIVRLEGVRLVLAQGDQRQTHDLGFVDFEARADVLTARCTHESGHDITVTLRGNASGDGFDVAVTDQVAGRNNLLELSLRYSAQVRGDVETWLPAHGGGAGFAGDRAWHLPLAYLRVGGLAAALTADVDQLAAERRLPQGMGIDPATGTVFHGLFAYASERDADDGIRHDMHGGEPVAVQGETLRFGHEMRLLPAATAGDELLDAIDNVWRDKASWLLHNSVAPLQESSVDRTARMVLVRAVRSRLAQMQGAMGKLATLRSERARETHGHRGADAWFTKDRQLLHTTRGLVAMNPGDPSLAREIVNLLLSSRRTNGLFPSVVSFDPGTGHRQADPEARAPGDRSGFHRTAHVGRTAYELVRIAQDVADLRSEILDACRRTASFFVANQRENGLIPAWFDLNYRAPNHDADRDAPLETASAAMFLAEFGRTARSEPATEAARRYLDWLDQQGFPGRAMATTEPVDALSLGFAARTATILANASRTAADLKRATGYLDALAPLQNANPRSDLPVSGHPGMFRCSLRDLDPTAGSASPDQVACTGVLAEILLDGYRLTGTQRHLERGVMALRAAQCGARWADLDPAWGPATAAVAALHAIGTLGEAVVDLHGGFGAGIECLWVSELELIDGTARVEILSDRNDQNTVVTTFRNAPDRDLPWRIMRDGELLGRGAGAELLRGLRLPLEQVPELEFRPPGMIHAGQPWNPMAKVRGWLPGDSCWVEVRQANGEVAKVPMGPADGRGIARAAAPFLAVDATSGALAEVRLAHERGGQVRHAPPRRWQTVEFGDAHCLDTGDDFEWQLANAETSRVVPFRNGRERARELRGGDSLTYRLELPDDTTRVQIDAIVSGALRIATNGQPLHEDDIATESVRTVQLELADRRLWRSGILSLTFENPTPDGLPLTLAKVLYRTEGDGTEAVSTGAGTSAPSNAPSASLRILVVPIQLDDMPLSRGRDALEQVFFGDSDYQVTPEPNSRRTAGSVATLIDNLSGGRTSCSGAVLDPKSLPELAAELTSMPGSGWDRIANRVAALDAAVGADWDLIAVVHGRHSEWGSPDGEILRAQPGQPAMVFVRDNEPDGSILSAATALGAMMRAANDRCRTDAPDQGSFGALTLMADGHGHVPSGLTGEDLAAVGWADPIRVPEDDGSVQIPNLYEDRAYLVFETLGLLGRGQLIAEEHSNGNAEPGLRDTGALLYWRRDATTAPLLVRADGSRARPERLRISPSTSLIESPFTPASAENDLFDAPITLDADTRPSLATPEGDDLWQLDGLNAAGDRRAADVDYRGRPLASWLWSWSSGDQALRQGDRRTEDGGVFLVDQILALAPSPFASRGIRGILEQPLPEAPHRLVARLELESPRGTARVSAGIGSDTLFDVVVGGNRPQTQLEFDLPSAAEGRLWLEVVDAGGSGPIMVRVPVLMLVPRQTVLDRITAGQVLPPTAPAVDGTWRSTVADLSITADGQTSWRGPLVVQNGSRMLRLLAHRLQVGPTEPIELTLTLRGTEGDFVHRVLDREPMLAGPGTPGLVLLAELPEATPDVIFAEIIVTGPNGAGIGVQSLEVLR